MDEIIRLNNTDYKLVGTITYQGELYGIVTRVEAEMYNFIHVVKDETTGRLKVEYASPLIVAELIDQLLQGNQQ